MVKRALLRLAADSSVSLTADERACLRRAAPHALWHTFGSYGAANEMPLDVLQRLLGHA